MKARQAKVKDEKPVRFTFRLPQSLFERWDQIARERGVSRSAIAVEAVEQLLERSDGCGSDSPKKNPAQEGKATL